MTTLTEEVRNKVIQSRDLMQEAIEMARPHNEGDLKFDTKEDELRFFLFMHCMEGAAKGTNSIARVCEMTDDDIRQMCAESDVTVSTAAHNARMNLLGDIVGSMLGGLFTPPQH